MSVDATGVTFRSIVGDRAIRTVIGVQFVFMLGLGVVLPLLPLFARSFDVSYAIAGLLGSGFGLFRLTADLAAGPLVDRHGERTVAVTGMLVLATGAILTGVAPAYPLAVVAWAIGGVGSAVTFAAQYSYLLKVVPRSHVARTLGVFYGSFNAGLIAGGIVGGVIAARWGFRVPFYVYAAILLIASALYVRYVPPAARRTNAPPLDIEEVLVEREAGLLRRGRKNIATLFANKGFTLAIVLNFAYMWMVATSMNTLLPLFGTDRLDLSTAGVGAAFAVIVAAESLILYPAGALSDRLGRKTVLVPSVVALTVLAGSIGLVTSFGILLLLMIPLGFASGFAGVPPAAVLSDSVPEESAGAGVGMFRFAGDLALFLGPTLAGLAVELWGFEWAFALSSLPLVGAFLLTLRTPETLKRG